MSVEQANHPARELLDQQETVQIGKTMQAQITELCELYGGVKRSVVCRMALARALPMMLNEARAHVTE